MGDSHTLQRSRTAYTLAFVAVDECFAVALTEVGVFLGGDPNVSGVLPCTDHIE